MVKKLSLLGLCCLLAVGASSQVLADGISYDGSLASRGGVAAGSAVMNNNTYTIPQNKGVTQGSNLFHSFDQFNLRPGEIADFTGSRVNNVISRVTGVDSSNINGTIKSSIP